MTDTTPTDRLEQVVDAFGLVATYDASPHEIQNPVRTLINRILEGQNETRQELVTQAAGRILRRYERHSDQNVYFLTDEGEAVDERIRRGCEVFYDRVYHEMLDEDPIRLAKRRGDLLDGIYLLVAEKRREETDQE